MQAPAPPLLDTRGLRGWAPAVPATPRVATAAVRSAVAPFAGRLSALLHAARCAIAGARPDAARAGSDVGGSEGGAEGGETEAEAEAEAEAELVRAWVRLALAGRDGAAEAEVEAAATAAADAATAAAATAAAENGEDDALIAAVAGDPALLERARLSQREAADVRAWLRRAAADAAADAAGGADARGLEAEAEAMAGRVTAWWELRDEADALQNPLAAGYVAPGGPSPAARAALATRLRELLDARAALRRLHDLLLAPLGPALPPAGEPLLIIPDLELFAVPWAALTGPGDAGPLVVRHSIRTAPSLAVSAAARGRRPPARDAVAKAGVAEAVVVGDPWPLGRAGFEHLPQALEEARDVADTLQVVPVTGAKATRQAVVRLLGGARLAHLACHGWLERRALLLAVRVSRNGSMIPADPLTAPARRPTCRRLVGSDWRARVAAQGRPPGHGEAPRRPRSRAEEGPPDAAGIQHPEGAAHAILLNLSRYTATAGIQRLVQPAPSPSDPSGYLPIWG